jgi:hypothetical protein
MKTQGQVGEQMRVFIELLNGKMKSQNILVGLPKPPNQRGVLVRMVKSCNSRDIPQLRQDEASF